MLTLSIANFKKHASLDIELTGKWILIKGESGSGKSTLFAAIVYALYGEGKKIAPWIPGTNIATPQIRLKMDNVDIIRSSSSRVSVNGIETCAQTIIDTQFGNYELFKMAGWLEQKSKHNFVALPPICRLKFVESISRVDIQEIKDVIKKERANLSQQIMYSKGQLSIFDTETSDAKNDGGICGNSHETDQQLVPDEMPITQKTCDDLEKQWQDKCVAKKHRQHIESEITRYNELMNHTEHVDETRLEIMRKIVMVASKIKKNTMSCFQCPHCHTQITGAALNAPLKDKMDKYISEIKYPVSMQTYPMAIKTISDEIARHENTIKKKHHYATSLEYLESQTQTFPDKNLEDAQIAACAKALARSRRQLVGGKLAQTRTKMAMDELRVQAIDRLRVKIDHIQATYNHQIVEVFNQHANMYMEGFFSRPTLIKINSFTKTGRPQIDFEILFDGMWTNISALSGGEYDRVLLAMTMGINTIIGCPFILLDETMSSLDPATMSKVMGTISRLYPGIILYIGHTDETSSFDQVVCIGE